MNLYVLIKPLGIVSYSLMALAALTGLFRFKMKWHKWLGLSALILATLHFIIVIYVNR